MNGCFLALEGRSSVARGGQALGSASAIDAGDALDSRGWRPLAMDERPSRAAERLKHRSKHPSS